MSYYTSMAGRIEIEPPLSWSEIKDSKHTPDQEGRWPAYPDLVFEIEREVRDTDEGTLSIVRAVAIVPGDYETRGGAAEAELGALLAQHGTRHVFTGRIDGMGEDNEDMWRLKPIGTTAVKFKPKFVWPEGSE